MSHRFRLDRKNLTTRRSSFSVSAGPKWLTGYLSYIKLSDGPTIGVPVSLEQVNMGMDISVWERWRLNLSHERDLTESGGSLMSHLSLIYENECVLITSSINRYFTQSADLEPTTNFIVRVTLRNLG